MSSPRSRGFPADWRGQRRRRSPPFLPARATSPPGSTCPLDPDDQPTDLTVWEAQRTLLCWVKCWLGLQESVELAGDVADQAAFDLAGGLALGPSPLGVGAGRWGGGE